MYYYQKQSGGVKVEEDKFKDIVIASYIQNIIGTLFNNEIIDEIDKRNGIEMFYGRKIG